MTFLRIEVIQDKPRNARDHMEIDRTLVEKGAASPRLRIYEWAKPAITAGLFSEPERFLHLDRCLSGIVLRPTGGGILFHQADIVCAVFLPMAQVVGDVCRAVNSRLLAAVSPFLPPIGPSPALPAGPTHFCMAHPSAADLLWNGKKIGGCAFRKTRRGILQQASLFLREPDWSLIAPCVRREEDLRAMKEASISIEELAGPVDRKTIREAIAEQFKGELP